MARVTLSWSTPGDRRPLRADLGRDDDRRADHAGQQYDCPQLAAQRGAVGHYRPEGGDQSLAVDDRRLHCGGAEQRRVEFQLRRVFDHWRDARHLADDCSRGRLDQSQRRGGQCRGFDVDQWRPARLQRRQPLRSWRHGGQFLQTNGAGVLSWATPAGGGGGGVPEAPTDSRNYARYNATWNPIVSFPEAPGDGQYYARRQLSWQAIPPGPPTIADTAPASPAAGQMWFDSVGGQTYLWYPDPNTSQWVPATNTQGQPGVQGPQGATGPAGATGPQGPAGTGIGDNRIINGDMRIDQRNSGASGSANGYTIDRWAYAGSVASKGCLAAATCHDVSWVSLSAFVSLFFGVRRSRRLIILFSSRSIEADMISRLRVGDSECAAGHVVVLGDFDPNWDFWRLDSELCIQPLLSVHLFDPGCGRLDEDRRHYSRRHCRDMGDER